VDVSRRAVLRALGAAAVGAMLPAGNADARSRLISRPIPSSGERLPVVGLGTWETFDVGGSRSDREPLEAVIRRFAELGGTVIDSSPMYGRSESVVGEIVETLGLRDRLFLATKVWTSGKRSGIAQMNESIRRFRTNHVDLMQVHNLVDVDTHLATLREWKSEGRARYVGITHYTSSAYAEVARVLKREQIDTLQINYSVVERSAEDELLPLAKDRGVAVIVNRPFGGGSLFSMTKGKPLPGFAAELGCTSWAQLSLKWILGHPAVTCAIPGTSKVKHLEDNLGAGVGAIPDAAMRRRILDAVRGLR